MLIQRSVLDGYESDSSSPNRGNMTSQPEAVTDANRNHEQRSASVVASTTLADVDGSDDSASWAHLEPLEGQENLVEHGKDDLALEISDDNQEKEEILILSGSEDDKGISNRASQQYHTAAKLSFSEIDAFPTDIVTDSSNTAFQTTGEEKSSTRVDDHSHAGEGAEQSPRASSSLSRAQFSQRVDGALSNENKQTNLVVAIAILVSLLSMAYVVVLTRDRHSWKSTALQLQTELDEVRAQLEASQNRSTSAVHLLAHLLGSDSCEEQDSEEFCFETKSKQDWDHDDFLSAANNLVLADNCWLKAKASVKLGECMENARDSLVDMTTNLYNTVGNIGNLGKKLWKEPSKFFPENTFKPSDATLESITEVTAALSKVTDITADAIRSAATLVDDSIHQVL